MSAKKDELVDMEEAIKLLKTSRPTFYRWLRAGRITGMKAGRQWRFRRDDLDEFLNGKEPRVDLAADIGPLIATLDAELAAAGAASPPPEEHKPQQVVRQLIALAAARRASDIHLAAYVPPGSSEAEGVIRLRVDGTLQVAAAFDARLLPALVREWKALAACNVLETTLPQDGRVRFTLPAVREDGSPRPLDMRVAFLRSTLGETVTVRILEPAALSIGLDRLDYSPHNAANLRDAMRLPSGVVLCTGPMGSGKTTTLYACLNEVARPEVKVMTIEDPVEYVLPWATQVAVREAEGLTFEQAIRACLRADPDVIMLGEFRSMTVVQAAIAAAMTGHLVLGSLHTQDAAGALVRLRDIGIDGFAIGEAVKLVVAQRLIRKLCAHCRRPGRPSARHLEWAKEAAAQGGLDWRSLKPAFMTAPGCPKCARTGFRGRTVVAETLVMTPEIGRALRDGADGDAIGRLAVGQGMVTLTADAVRRAAKGEISLAEAVCLLSLR